MQSILVTEDLSKGVEAFKLRVLNQYNNKKLPPQGFEYITAVEQLAMEPKESVEPPKPEPDEACKCESTCTNACHYDEANSMLRACKAQCACNSQAKPCAVARFTRPTTRFQVFYTTDKGWSMQTLEDIKPGQALFEYVGVLSVDENQQNLDNDDYIFAFWHDSNRYLLNAHLKGNMARFVNHSCQPNCCPMLVEASEGGGIPRVLIYPLRKIYAGEELSMDYGEDWWLAKADTVQGCCCKSEDCQYDEDWCDSVVQNHGRAKTPPRQIARKAMPARYAVPPPRPRQMALKGIGVRPGIKPRPGVATMEPKELEDLPPMGKYGDAEEEEEMEPPPEKKLKEANGTAAAADGNN